MKKQSHQTLALVVWYSNFQMKSANSFRENYSNSTITSVPCSNLFGGSRTQSAVHPSNLPTVSIQEKSVNLLLKINKEVNNLGKIYESVGNMINVKQLKTKDKFDEFNEKPEYPNEKANLVIKQIFNILSL